MKTATQVVEGWLKRHKRKTFFLFHRIDKVPGLAETYYLIWNDKNKTKYGYISDGAYVRHGFETIAVLNGETAFQLWLANPKDNQVNDRIFKEMLAVRQGDSRLPAFNLEDIRNLNW